MKASTLVVAVVAFLALTTTAHAQQGRANVLQEIGHLRVATWSCQRQIHVSRTRASVDVWALPTSLDYRRWVKDLWQQRAVGCQGEYRRRTLSAASWRDAVAEAGRAYPGTSGWLWSCSGGEGGHSGFVYNREGSGAAGWMQFMPDTFSKHVADAYADLDRRGFIVDHSTASLFHPLGQALVAAYMISHGATDWNPDEDAACSTT